MKTDKTRKIYVKTNFLHSLNFSSLNSLSTSIQLVTGVLTYFNVKLVSAVLTFHAFIQSSISCFNPIQHFQLSSGF